MSDARGPQQKAVAARDGSPVGGSRGVYGISVAAELVGSSPQSLRLYEAHGLLSPARTDGGTRRYSGDDLERLRAIGRLLDDGLNLAGVAAVLALRAANDTLRMQLEDAGMMVESDEGHGRGGGGPEDDR